MTKVTETIEVTIEVVSGTFVTRVEFDTQDTLAVIGPNGSGKTTLLRSILGLVQGQTSVRVGADLLDSRPTEARRLAYVPQKLALFPHLTVQENVAFGAHAETQIAELLQRFELDRLRQRRPRSLSGGEAQRVAIARAVAMKPRAYLFDEPFSALDPLQRQRTRDLVTQVLADAGVPALLVTHDRRDVEQLAAGVIVLDSGSVEERFDVEDRDTAQSAFARALFAQ